MTTATLDRGRALHAGRGSLPGGRERLIEGFMPEAQVRESHEVSVGAPSDLVMEVAETFDLMSVPIVYAIFRLRSTLMRAPPPERDELNGLVPATRRMGWVELARRPGREIVMGAAVQPWLAAPVFKPVAPERFMSYAEPDHVKIVWTLEAEPMGPARTRFRTETRVLATDASARRKFRWYWMRAGIGIVVIRRLMLRALRRDAERRARHEAADPASGVAGSRRDPFDPGERKESAGRPSSSAQAPLLDRLLPTFDSTLVRETTVEAPAAVTYAAMADTNLLDPVVRALFTLRELPARFTARLQRERHRPTPRSLTMNDFLRPGTGMVRLAESPGAEIVVGSVGRLWEADYGHRDVAPDAFTRFSHPGCVKLAMDLRVTPIGDRRSTLRYEARTAATDAAARRRFRRYWRIIRPGVGLVMGRAVHLVRKEAERRAANVPTAS